MRNNIISRSRSRERHLEDDYETNRNDNKRQKQEKNRKELEIEEKIEYIKEKQKIREKEREFERLNFLKREKDLLIEINTLKHQNNIYNDELKKKFYYQRYQYSKYIRPQKPKESRFSNFKKNIYFPNNERDNYRSFDSYNNNQIQNYEGKRENIYNYNENKFDKSKFEFEKIITNLNEGNKKEVRKFKEKIDLPKIQGVNLVGLLIGPKGIFLKLLEKQSGCKIFINGRSTGKREKYINPDDNDHSHVLIIADSEEKLKRGIKLVNDIINADENTRNKIINEQLKVSKQEGFESLNLGFKKDELKLDDYLMTHNGPPGKKARFYKVPDDCIDFIIGNKGETIKNIEIESNCKIQIAKAPIPNTKLRYIFIEGSEENYEIAKEYIEKIIGDYVNMNIN